MSDAAPDVPLVSQTVFPAAFAILNGSENTGANLCALVGSFTRTHSPGLELRLCCMELAIMVVGHGFLLELHSIFDG